MKILKNIVCFIFNHRYRLLRNVAPGVRELKCKRCEKEFGMNDELEVVLPLDNELKAVHNLIKN